ncbi:hypothetical protein MSG28_011744 [Choristoneura fumiferana]|uniref:Uncharacterized protein n=1 Tax=Choristoneura fumiferana TaxID=7141 RepID=A0ACC0KMZ6_CHOFU|nr:hypothetical protein MSG28_011744 [Choristoneura fumiferana]
MKKLYLSVIALVLLQVCDAFKILVVFPLPGKSHNILGEGYVRHLLNAGHEVTYITPYPKKNPHKNLTQIDVSDNMKGIPTDLLSIQSIMDKKVDFDDTDMLFHFFTHIAELTTKNENVIKLINDPKQQFDVAITEWMFSELYAGFAPIFNCPLIWSSSMAPHWMVTRLIDEYTNPAIVPDSQTANFPPFTFTQRLQELWIQVSTTFKKITIYDKMEENTYNTRIAPVIAKKGRPVPTFDEVKFNASLLIANTHVSLGQAMTLPQNCITIGGYHIDDVVQPLPKDLQKIMDDSKHGVIYFSMGSNLQASKIPGELKKGFIKMFGELKQTVLWKFEENLPAHPNCILFITHGGYLSTTETVHFGVPIIGIPVFADQFTNVERAVSMGFAQRVDLAYDMVDKLKAAIGEVVRNPG